MTAPALPDTRWIPVTMEDLLGIEASGRSLSLPQLVATGLPVGSINTLSGFVAPDDPGFKHRLITRATLERRRRSTSKRLTIEEGERVARLARAFNAAIEIYRDPALARKFMGEAHSMLGGERPIDAALATDAGAEAVVQLIGRAAYSGGV